MDNKINGIGIMTLEECEKKGIKTLKFNISGQTYYTVDPMYRKKFSPQSLLTDRVSRA